MFQARPSTTAANTDLPACFKADWKHPPLLLLWAFLEQKFTTVAGYTEMFVVIREHQSGIRVRESHPFYLQYKHNMGSDFQSQYMFVP